MSDTAFWSLMAVYGAGMAVCGALQRRNHAVWRFRNTMIDRMIALNRSGEEVMDLLEEYRTVSYDQQFFRFWKPLDSFWPADSKLRSAGVLGGRPQ